jgi:hypothetical protein
MISFKLFNPLSSPVLTRRINVYLDGSTFLLIATPTPDECREFGSEAEVLSAAIRLRDEWRADSWDDLANEPLSRPFPGLRKK